MENFTYYTPTKIIFGKNTLDQTAAQITQLGAKKVLIHYGGGSVVHSGLLARVYDNLQKSGIAYTSLGGGVPNPRLEKVNEGI